MYALVSKIHYLQRPRHKTLGESFHKPPKESFGEFLYSMS